jgi:ubiquinone/menaquinone biosynthesis C-methylase UbiE
MTSNNVQNSSLPPKAAKGYKGIAMEGMIARWYAQTTKNREDHKLTAKRVTEHLAGGSRVLEVAPGPGYLSIEIAQLGNYKVVGLDISKTMVEIAQANARTAGVAVEFRHGEAADMPFDDDTFDFIVCTAAFKNFTEPVRALNEMCRVLKTGGKALIADLRRDASWAGIDEEVKKMGLNAINSLIVKWTFRQMLLKSAYTKAEIQGFVAQTGFRKCQIPENSIGFEVWLEK